MTLLCQIYLGLLSVYHIGTGMLSFFSSDAALKFYKAFYGTDPLERRHLRLILKPWGALSIAIGIAGTSAAGDPAAHAGTVLAIGVLLVLRIIYRIHCRAEMHALSRVPGWKNLANLSLLGTGLGIIVSWWINERPGL